MKTITKIKRLFTTFMLLLLPVGTNKINTITYFTKPLEDLNNNNDNEKTKKLNKNIVININHIY